MNGDDDFAPPACNEEIVVLGRTTPQIVLHRLEAARRAKGVPRRELARRLGITVQERRATEESADLSISTLCHWASELHVPISELVVETDDCLTPTHLAGSQAARLMKLAAKLRDRSRRRSIQRLAQTFVEQLTEILPSLEQLAKRNHGIPRRSDRQPPARIPRGLGEEIFTRHHEPHNR